MPIPTRKKGEDKDKFIIRCINDNIMKSEYPKDKQRAAICYFQAKK